MALLGLRIIFAAFENADRRAILLVANAVALLPAIVPASVRSP
jgi:hypothetical protein